MNDSLKQAAEKGLIDAGIPANFAAQCAEILAKKGSKKENLGRLESGQNLANGSMS
jgi:hypothetical protein